MRPAGRLPHSPHGFGSGVALSRVWLRCRAAVPADAGGQLLFRRRQACFRGGRARPGDCGRCGLLGDPVFRWCRQRDVGAWVAAERDKPAPRGAADPDHHERCQSRRGSRRRRVRRAAGQHVRPGQGRLPELEPRERLQRAGRVVRRDHPRQSGLGRRQPSALLHRPPHRDLERVRVRPRRLERRRGPERRLRRPDPRRLLPEHRRAFRADRTKPTDEQKAAIVQAAVWFFTDRYVLDTDDPLHNAVAALVTSVITAGPIVQPPPPSLTITPASMTGEIGHTVGPFTVNASVDAVVTATGGATMWKDAGATQPISNGATVPPGTQIWLKSATRRHGDAPGDGERERPLGERLPLQRELARSHERAEADPREDGRASDHRQRPGRASRAPARSRSTRRSPARLPASRARSRSRSAATRTLRRSTTSRFPPERRRRRSRKTYTHILAGAHCTVTETADGHTDTILVTVDGSGQSVTIPANDTVKASLTDTVNLPAPGSLIVHKTIAGAAAGQQGTVRIRVICDETPDNLPVFEIPAGTIGHRLAHLRRHPRGRPLHRHRARERQYLDRAGSGRRKRADGDRPVGIDADRRPHRHLHVRAGLAHRPEVDRRCRRRPPGGGEDRGRLRQGLAGAARLRDSRRYEGRHGLEDVPRHPGRVRLHRDGDRRTATRSPSSRS